MIKRTAIAVLSAAVITYTLWYMSFGELTINAGALSKIGLRHPVLFAVWGILTYTALYSNIFYLNKMLYPKAMLHYFFAAAALAGIILTVTCSFDYSLPVQYCLHCTGSLCFSVTTGLSVFLIYLRSFGKSLFYKISTVIIGLLLFADLILLLIYKETALIEAVPIIFGLIIMPLTILTHKTDKEYTYAS